MASPLSAEQEQLVRQVMDCAFAVHSALGPGFREAVYQTALCLEMDSRRLQFECEKRIAVRYKEWEIPGQRVDLLVGGFLLVEVKTVPRLRRIHQSQVLSYLKTMDLHLGLLMNFNSRLLRDGLKRVVR